MAREAVWKCPWQGAWRDDTFDASAYQSGLASGKLDNPDYQAGYVAGRDAWGHPVIPAETPPYGQGLPLTVELDVLLAQKQIAGRDLNLSATAPLDIAPRAGGAWSGPGPQDCFPAFK